MKKVYDSFIHIVKEQLKHKNFDKKKSTNILLCKIKDKEVHKGEGKYGPFILYNKKFTNINYYLKTNNKKLEDINLNDCKKIL